MININYLKDLWNGLIYLGGSGYFKFLDQPMTYFALTIAGFAFVQFMAGQLGREIHQRRVEDIGIINYARRLSVLRWALRIILGIILYAQGLVAMKIFFNCPSIMPYPNIFLSSLDVNLWILLLAQIILYTWGMMYSVGFMLEPQQSLLNLNHPQISMRDNNINKNSGNKYPTEKSDDTPSNSTANIVIRFKDDRILKGTSSEFHRNSLDRNLSEGFTINASNGDQRINPNEHQNDIKAIYIVDELMPTETKHDDDIERPTHVVTFYDNEKVSTAKYSKLTTNWFQMNPTDGSSNNRSMIVPKNSITSIKNIL